MRDSRATLKLRRRPARAREKDVRKLMIANSPIEALGPHAQAARELLVEVVRDRHGRSVEAHEVTGSRYAMGFASQWRDLLDDTREAFKDRGYASFKLAPAGYRLPIVNGCLLFVWRVPSEPDAVSRFASSTTRRRGFFSQQPLDMFGPSFLGGGEAARDPEELADLERFVQEARAHMPVVLVKVNSSPRELTSIEWAVAEYVDDKVRLSGEETIWAPELVGATVDSDVASFDSGTPVAPVIEARAQEQRPDA